MRAHAYDRSGSESGGKKEGIVVYRPLLICSFYTKTAGSSLGYLKSPCWRWSNSDGNGKGLNDAAINVMQYDQVIKPRRGKRQMGRTAMNVRYDQNQLICCVLLKRLVLWSEKAHRRGKGRQGVGDKSR